MGARLRYYCTGCGREDDRHGFSACEGGEWKPMRDPKWRPEPLPWWAHLLIGVAVGFAICFLMFVPM